MLITVRSSLNIPSDSLFGVLVEPSSRRWLDGLVNGGECTRERLDLREIGADIDGLRELAKLNGRPSSESLSPDVPESVPPLYASISDRIICFNLPCVKHCP